MIPINKQLPEKRRQDDTGFSLDVHSVFYTMQGEGPYTGYPCVFVRLAGCNLQCPSCDTEYTENRTTWVVTNLVGMVVDKFPLTMQNRLVVITGGEPFRQNIAPFVRELLRRNVHVQVETNGTLSPPHDFPIEATVVCSPKAGKVHQKLWAYIDAYKYVLSHDSVDMDGLPIRALNHSASPCVARPHDGFNGPVYLQPMDPKDDYEYTRNVQAVKRSCMQNGYILQLQVHKIIGVE